jgi:RHS repeat-associated protein
VSQYNYDSYGRPSLIQGTNLSDFQYAGYYFHQPSGLSQTITRAYNPSFGKWLSRDVVEEAGGINMYDYVQNNPINYTDFLGLFCASCTSSMVSLTSPFPKWPLPWPPHPGIGRPGEAPFLNCKYGNSPANCRTCCGNKFDDLHAPGDKGWCDKKYGPNGTCPDPRKYKCCVAWATRYLEFCLRRCNGGWGWNDPTPPPDDPDCQDPNEF